MLHSKTNSVANNERQYRLLLRQPKEHIERFYEARARELTEYYYREYRDLLKHDKEGVIRDMVFTQLSLLRKDLRIPSISDIMGRETIFFHLANISVSVDGSHAFTIHNSTIVYHAAREAFVLANGHIIYARLSDFGSKSEVWWFLDTFKEYLEEACRSDLWRSLPPVLECTACSLYISHTIHKSVLKFDSKMHKGLHMDFICHDPLDKVIVALQGLARRNAIG